jgi:hypothetical protein
MRACCLRCALDMCADSRRAGAVTQVPSQSSHRTRSIAAMTAGSSGSSPSARRAWRFVVIHTLLDAAPSRTVPARHASPVVWFLALFVFPHRHWADVAQPAWRPGLRRVNRCAAMASPLHMSTAAGAPHGTDRPAWVCVGVAVGAAGWWHDHPTAIGGHEVADKVVGELVTPRLGHGDFVT